MYLKIPKAKIARIQIVKTDRKLSLQQVVAKYKCDAAINGGLYDMHTGEINPIPLRINGQTIATSPDGYWCLAWDVGPDIKMIHSRDMTKYKNVVACSAMLKDGRHTDFHYQPAQGGIRGRTGIGCDKGNLHLFVSNDGSGALSPTALRSKMQSNGCLDAIMMDCGGSSQGFDGKKYYQSERRKVAYWVCVWYKQDTVTKPAVPAASNKCPYPVPTVTLRKGNTGAGVKWVQWHLKQTVAPAITVGGRFSTYTHTSVCNFQRKYGLDVDGIVGRATKEKMQEVCHG